MGRTSARVLVDAADDSGESAGRLAKILVDWARQRDRREPLPSNTEATVVTLDVVPMGGRTLAWIALTPDDVDELGRLLASR